MKNDFHIHLEQFVVALEDSIEQGSATKYMGIVITKLVNYRTHKMAYLGDDYKAEVTYNALLKFNKVFTGEKDFTTEGKKPLQLLNYAKVLVNYAALEEHTKLRRKANKMKGLFIVNIDNVNPDEFAVEPDAEALYHFKHEYRVNGKGLDLYDMV